MSPATEPAPRPARILVVDDERDNRELLEIILTHEGFVVETAADGPAALAAVAREAPDLVLLDVMMPGMTGYQVAERLKADPATRGVPLVMVSALYDRDSRALALKAGAEDFFAKPMPGAELCGRVRYHLHVKTHGK